MFQLGAREALENDMESLVQLNGAGSVVKIEVDISVAGTLNCLQQKDTSHGSSSRSTNVNQYLMENQKKAQSARSRYERNRLPHPKADSNGRCKLWNALLEFCIENGVKFFDYLDESERNETFNSIVSILWKLNLVEIGMQDWKKRPPNCMNQFLGYSFHDTRADGGKRKRPPLNQDILNDIHKKLTSVLDSVCFTEESVKMFEFLNGLLESIDCQIEDCLHRAQRKSTKKLEESWKAMWSKWNGNTLAGQDVRIKKVIPQFLPPSGRYQKLNQALMEKPLYTPLPLCEYMPNSSSRKYCCEYRRNIQTPYNTVVVLVKHGGSIRDDAWIFRISPSDDGHHQRFNDAIKKCQSSSSFYIQKWIQVAFEKGLDLLCPDVQLLKSLCSSFLGNGYGPQNAHYKHQKELIELSIQSADRSMLEDARKLNGRHSNVAFAEFWRLTEEFMNEAANAAHARRHGSGDVAYLSEIISIRDLHETIKKRMKIELGERYEEDLVPSVSTLYLQFMPSSNRLLTSLRFRCRFKVQMKIQRRILHLQHIDAHYGNALIKYLRSFAVRYRDKCSFYSADDKARITIGPPGVYLQTGVRNKPQLTPSGAELLALDHDYDGTCIVPSVYLQHDIPDKVNGDWYKGHVTVGLKDAVFQKSCPWRHVEELSRHVERNRTPILMLLTDGGPDRMLKRATVVASYISLFLKHDLDMLIVARTVPFLSFRNPVERVMSVLNLALQNVSLCRGEIPELEEELKGCNSMGAIREKAKQFRGGQKSFENLLHKSLENTMKIIGGRMQRLKWKEEDVKMYEAAEWDDILPFISMFLEVDKFSDKFKDRCLNGKSIDWSELQSKTSIVAEFMEKHVYQSPYLLQIKKVSGCDCSLCSRKIIKHPRLDQDEFENLNWVPLPLKSGVDNDGNLHYKDFDEIYGSFPNHTEQPSLRDSKPERKGKHGIYTANRARSFLICSSCSKRRVVYVGDAQRSLTKTDKHFIKQINELGLYVCGSHASNLLSKRNENEEPDNIMDLTHEENAEECLPSEDFKFYLRHGLTCSTPMESSYFFGNRLHQKRNLKLCSHCGLGENHIAGATREELLTYSKVFHPCSVCLNITEPKQRPKPLYGSKKKKRSLDVSLSTRTPIERSSQKLDSDSDQISLGEMTDTEPSGDYSVHSDSD